MHSKDFFILGILFTTSGTLVLTLCCGLFRQTLKQLRQNCNSIHTIIVSYRQVSYRQLSYRLDALRVTKLTVLNH